MLSRRCDLPLPTIGSIARAVPDTREQAAPAAMVEPMNWRREAIVMCGDSVSERKLSAYGALVSSRLPLISVQTAYVMRSDSANAVNRDFRFVTSHPNRVINS